MPGYGLAIGGLVCGGQFRPQPGDLRPQFSHPFRYSRLYVGARNNKWVAAVCVKPDGMGESALRKPIIHRLRSDPENAGDNRRSQMSVCLFF